MTQTKLRPVSVLFAKSGQLVIESDENDTSDFLAVDYIDNLEDYYQRNECIREQQYLSHDKLLHLAAFWCQRLPSPLTNAATRGGVNEGRSLARRHSATVAVV